MEVDYYPQEDDIFNNKYLSPIPPVAEEKYSNIKILGQNPIQYKDSPFDSQKRQRKNINEITSLFKENDPNSDYSIDLSEDINKKRKNKPIDNIREPYYTTNRDYKKTKFST